MQITKYLFTPAPLRKIIFIAAAMISLLMAVLSVQAQIWEDFTVWYDGNGADSGHINEVYYKSGSNDVTLKENAAASDSEDVPYVKQGCTFLGWSLEPENGSVITPIMPGGTVWDPVDVPVTWTEDRQGFVFYARWECGSSVMPSPQSPTATPVITATPFPTSTPASAVSVYTSTPIPTSRPASTAVPTMTNTAEPNLLISPDINRVPSASAPEYHGPTPTPVLLIYPDIRSRMVGKDGSDMEKDDGTGMSDDSGLLISPMEQKASGNSDTDPVRKLPVLFTPENGELPALPATGITTMEGYKRSHMPASVSYAPTHLELQIPTLDINSKIVFVENDESGYPVQWLEMETGLLADSSLPGEGFSILAAHNTLNAEDFGPFAMIHALRSGDRLFVRTDRNDLMIFEVYSNEKINEYDYEALYQAGSLYDNTITLLTCEDERPEGGYINRRIVSARKLN